MNCGANSNNTPMCCEQEYVCEQGMAIPMQLRDDYWRARYIRSARYTVGTYTPTGIRFFSNRYKHLPGYRPRPIHLAGPVGVHRKHIGG